MKVAMTGPQVHTGYKPQPAAGQAQPPAPENGDRADLSEGATLWNDKPPTEAQLKRMGKGALIGGGVCLATTATLAHLVEVGALMPGGWVGAVGGLSLMGGMIGLTVGMTLLLPH